MPGFLIINDSDGTAAYVGETREDADRFFDAEVARDPSKREKLRRMYVPLGPDAAAQGKIAPADRPEGSPHVGPEFLGARTARQSRLPGDPPLQPFGVEENPVLTAPDYDPPPIVPPAE